MDGWKGWKRAEGSFLATWYQRVRESYVAAWILGVFQSNTMSTSTPTGTGGGGGGGGGGVGGALTLMGCVREASPPPQNHQLHHHYQQQQQQQQQQQHRTIGLGELSAQSSVDPLPKEPKKRRFHPLRGLRKIFRRKSRGAADLRLPTGENNRENDLVRIPRQDLTDRHPGGRAEEARSRSASELLTDSCDREAVFLRRSGGAEESFSKLRGGAGKLSVSHDSVFPGEVPHTRPLSSLASLATLERRQARNSTEIEHKEYNQHVVQRHRISLRVLEQIKTVIENRNQLASATSSDSTGTATHNRFAGQEKSERSAEEAQLKVEVERKLPAAVAKSYSNNDECPRVHQEQRQPTLQPRKESIRPEDAIECQPKPEERSGRVVQVQVAGRIGDRPVRPKPEVRPRVTAATKKEQVPVREAMESPRSSKDTIDRIVPLAKEDLPELETASLNHTAALHRISVRPKNRRPPRRSGSQAADTSSSTITTIVEDALDNLDQQDQIDSIASSPIEPKTVSVTRKPSSRLSRNSDIFEELEAKLPKKPSSMASLSPDSLDTTATSQTSVELNEEQPEPRSIVRKASNRISKGSDIFDELEAKLPRRIPSANRLSKSPDSLETSPCWFSKSSDAFDKLVEYEEVVKPVVGRVANPISKSSDRVSKSSDSLEAIEALVSDESIERRRSSFEFRARRTSKLMSKSSENFEALDQAQSPVEPIPELQKRSSISDVNLARGRRLSKSISKSSESFEMIEVSDLKDVEVDMDSLGKCRRRSSNRMSSESSDNLELDDRLEHRRVRRSSKRIPSNSFIDIVPADDREEEKRSVPMRKSSRLQKSSESSELGSTDTLDSERRNKSSESTETLDSLERDLDHDRKQEEMAVSDVINERRDKNECWANRNVVAATDTDQTSVADGTEDSKSLISPDKFYWRQTSESKENLDIHQLLAITIVTRMADNGNNQRSSVIYPKKKQQITTSQPTSPVAKQEDNKMLFDNLLVSKNDEDLQNMLNGNISEVSTDTKSFKEKLIMFEKLGK